MNLDALLERMAALPVPAVPGGDFEPGTPEPAPILAVPGVPAVPGEKIEGQTENGKPPEATRPDMDEQARARIMAACRELDADAASALDWYGPDDWPDFAARSPEWARAVIQDALGQGFIRPARADPGPLDGLPLLPDDRRFIAQRTRWNPDLLAGYRRAWMHAAELEPVPHKRDNAGRRAANLWLLFDREPPP